MKTELLYIAENEQQALSRASQILKNDGVVAIPTETVYGLAASAYSDSAIKKVFVAKGRPQDNPLIVHIADVATLNQIAKDIPKNAYLLAQKFWPGPLTMVLKKTDAVAKSVSAGLDTVAIRMPSDITARKIIEKSGLALAAPSANSSGSPSPTTAMHVLDDLDGKIDAVVVGERCSVGVESTVISLVGEKPRLLRPGAVTLEQLSQVLGEVEVDKAVFAEPLSGEKVASPGMKYKHYAPKAQLILVEADTKSYCDYVNKQNDGFAVCFQEEAAFLGDKAIVYGSQNNPETLAYKLFDILRQLDIKGVKKGYVHAPEKNGVGLAVYNRVIRSCAYKVVRI